MSLLEVFITLNLLCAAGMLMTTYLRWFNRKSVKNINEILFISVSLVSHLILTGYLNIRYTVLHWVVYGGTSLGPFACWLLTRALTGKPRLKNKYLLSLFFLLLCCNYALAIWDRYSSPKYPDIFINIVSLGFMVHSILIIFQSNTIKKDIFENKERKIFLLGVISVIVISLMSELASKPNQLIYLFFLQRLSIVVLMIYFLTITFSLKEGIVRKKNLDNLRKDPALSEKIADVVTFDKLFLQEGITIAKLSEIIEEKEYKVRHAIIHDLGFKNFTDFINSFRINEASEMLIKPGNEGLSILEIAFHVGFSSIGPFNRAFKACTGLTPSQFRHAKKQSESNLVVA